MPKELHATWPADRLVAERLVTVTELETVLSVDDVMHYLAVADFWRVLTTPPEASR